MYHLHDYGYRNPVLVELDDPNTLTYRIQNLIPEHSYRVTVWASTSAGQGEEKWVEETTLPAGRKFFSCAYPCI